MSESSRPHDVSDIGAGEAAARSAVSRRRFLGNTLTGAGGATGIRSG